MSVPNGNFFVNCVRNIKNFNLTEEIAANLNEEKYKESVCVRVHLCVCVRRLCSQLWGGWRWNGWEGQRRAVCLWEVCGWMEVKHSGLRLELTCCLPARPSGWLYPPVQCIPEENKGGGGVEGRTRCQLVFRACCVDQTGAFHGWFKAIN